MRRKKNLVRAIDRMIADFTKRLEFVKTVYDVDSYELLLFGEGDGELRRKVVAERCCARHYRWKMLRLRCLRLYFCLRPC